jgi:hypothetical protein
MICFNYTAMYGCIQVGDSEALNHWSSGLPLAQTELDGTNKMEGIDYTTSRHTSGHFEYIV